MREKDIPVDVIELPHEDMESLFWEPHGTKFALLATAGTKNMIHLYQVESASSSAVAVKVIKSIDAKGVNTCSWSPKGRFCVLAGVRGLTGDMQFWDMEDIMLMGTGEHYMCTDIDWDPTGRYVVSSVSYWRVQNDTGFIMWSFTGQELTKQNISQFKQFLWRPRPLTLLTRAQEKKVKKNIKTYGVEFEEQDALDSNKASADVVGKRRSQWDEYKAFIARSVVGYQESLAQRIINFGFDPDAPKETAEIEVEVEEIYDEETIVLE